MKSRLLVSCLVLCVLVTVGATAPDSAASASIGEMAFTFQPIVVPVTPILLDPVVVNNYKEVRTVPLYRLQRQNTYGTTWHTYTHLEPHRTTLRSQGWVDDGVVTHVSQVRMPGTYRLYKWHYPPSVTYLTYNAATNPYSYGFVPQGITGFVLPTASVMPVGQQLVYRHSRIPPEGYSMFGANYYYTSDPSWPAPPEYSGVLPSFRGWTGETLLQKVSVETIGPNLIGGTKATIRWSTHSPGGVVELLYTTDDAANWTSIAKNLSNSLGQYEWTVPNIDAAKVHVMVRWSRDADLAAVAWATGPAFTIDKNPLITGFILSPWLLLSLNPAAPTSLVTMTGAGETATIELFWEDNSGEYETAFIVERKSGTAAFSVLATLPANTVSFTDMIVEAGTIYTYRVKAKASELLSEYSNEAEGVYYPPSLTPEETVPETPPAALAPPTGLTAAGLPGNERVVRLTWTVSTDAGIVGQVVERNTAGTWAQVTNLGASAQTHHDEVADVLVTLAAYRVKAYNEVVYSEPSGEAAVTFAAVSGPTFDGSQSGWAEAELAEAYLNGLTYAGIMSQFGRPITREEFCAIAVRLYEKLTGLTAVVGANPFADTSNPEVLKAFALEIVLGVNATQFAPYSNITRQEMSVMIFRTLRAAGRDINLPRPAAPFGFADASSIATWAQTEVRFCHHHQIMRGTSPTAIAPLLNTPREQAIILLLRAYNAFK